MTVSAPRHAVSARKTSGSVQGSADFTYALLSETCAPQPSGPAGDRRAGVRQRTRLRSGKVLGRDGRFIAECLFANRSTVGGLLRLAETSVLPAQILVFDDQLGSIQPASVVWRRGRDAGIRFHPTDPSARYRAIADAMRRKFYAMDKRGG